MTCSSCGTAIEPGRRFCGRCGAAVGLTRGTCETTNPGTDLFCDGYGAGPRRRSAGGTAVVPLGSRESPAAERRLVSVLFADLVGFTTLSESQDAEEVRELLSKYFDTCRI